MPSQAHSAARIEHRAARAASPRALVGAASFWLAEAFVPFLLVLYLGLEQGGYGLIARSEVGIVIWWFVLLGALVGALPRADVGRAGWAVFGLLAAFCAWTALGLGWTESNEQTMEELARVAMYLGVLALALTTFRAGAAHRVVSAVGAAIAVIGVLALLSRLQPNLFPVDQAAQFVSFAENRLNYPVTYWNGLAALIAMGIPLLLGATVYLRSIAGQAVAAAAVPALALALFFTLSRGGVLELGVAAVILLAVSADRGWLASSMLVAGAGSAILIAAASERAALEAGAGGEAALTQGDEMTVIAIAVCAGAGLLQAALGYARREHLGPRFELPRRAAPVAIAATLALVLVVAVAAGAPSRIGDAWEDFKQPGGTAGEGTERLVDASGEGRYQLWQSAADAAATDPVTGIGAGTFEYWWSREATFDGYVANAHSLAFETLAETGIVGIALLAAFFATAFFAIFRRLGRVHPGTHGPLAAVLAAGGAFLVAAAIDWVWDLAVLPVAMLLLLGAGLVARNRPATSGRTASRAAVAFTALAATIAIAIPLASTESVRSSQANAAAGDLPASLDEARDAAVTQPNAATPELQEALVLEQLGELEPAIAAAEAATLSEPTNWRTWLTLSRLQAQAGEVEASVDSYRRARSLNPRSPLFAP